MVNASEHLITAFVLRPLESSDDDSSVDGDLVLMATAQYHREDL